VSDPKKTQPDDDLLEFLGDIDEANDEAQNDGFADFLAKNDIDKVAREMPNPPAKEGDK
jgi:hypothetical protein